MQVSEVIETLSLLFSQEKYDLADQFLSAAKKIPELYNDTIAIYDATLAQKNNRTDEMWTAIQQGLSHNPKNFELYMLLGEYYLPTNPNQAWLCYENALFFCTDEDDKQQIQFCLDTIKQNHAVTVRQTSFVILSYNLLDYTRNCIESIRTYVPESARELVVVDNASTDGSVAWLREQPDIILVENTENAGFPKGCNQGAAAASKENDIFLLNNDTLMTPNALFWLRMGLYENSSVGTVGSISNYVGNMQITDFPKDTSTEQFLSYAYQNNIPMAFPYEEKLYLVGFALLISRKVWDEIGELDELFSPGNYEDNDFGLRVLKAGYKNILCRNSFIVHFGSKSFGQNVFSYNKLLFTNSKKFKSKWNIDPKYFFHPRSELATLVREDTAAPLTILDIGCGGGALIAYLKGQYPNATTHGVELVPEAADIAKYFANVLCDNVECMEFPWPEDYFDYIILGDVLEHLHEPENVLKKLHKHLKPTGQIIVSVPNVKHFSVMQPLIVSDRFSYTDAGILDRTHLKMYTGTELIDLVTTCGYSITEGGHTENGQPNEKEQQLINTLITFSESKDPTDYLAYQYVIKARKC